MVVPKLANIVADLLRVRAITLARFDAGLRKRTVSLLKELERSLVARIADDDYTGDMTTLDRAKVEATLNWARSTIETSYRRIDTRTTGELRDMASIEARWIEREFNRAIGVKVMDVGMTPMMLTEIISNSYVRGNPMADWWRGQSADLARRFASEMRLGLISGDSFGKLIARVRGTFDGGYEDGIMAVSRRHAEGLVRTAVQDVANRTRMKLYEANNDIVGSLQHLSTLDARTTVVCAVRDGKRWDLKTHKPIGHDLPFVQPPVHWGCRSTLTPVLKVWRDMGFEEGDLTPKQRASMDGLVPDTMTYEQWLRGKDEEFQNKILGEGRAELWRGGHITFRELLDQRGRPLTLAQLEENF